MFLLRVRIELTETLNVQRKLHARLREYNRFILSSASLHQYFV